MAAVDENLRHRVGPLARATISERRAELAITSISAYSTPRFFNSFLARQQNGQNIVE